MSANAVDQGATGAAGGVLAGTYPNPSFAAPAPVLTGGAAGGGLTGTYPNPGLAAASVVAGVAGQALAPASLAVAGNITQSALGTLTTNGVDVSLVGGGLKVAEGANAKQGTAVLVAGTVTVANTSVTASSRILLTTQAPGGTAGFLVVSARVAGTSFTILSSNAADTSTVAFQIFEPG